MITETPKGALCSGWEPKGKMMMMMMMITLLSSCTVFWNVFSLSEIISWSSAKIRAFMISSFFQLSDK
jgi:hypothetical protein